MIEFLRKIKMFITDYKFRYSFLRSKGMYAHLSDEDFLKKAYEVRFDKNLNLEEPVSFNEKLQWLKIHDKNQLYVTMVDKIAVKEYVKTKIGEEYIIKTLGTWDKFDEIDFSLLPNSFVLKCSHDSGSTVVCKEKEFFDLKKAKKQIEKCLSVNYYNFGREFPYKDVTPRILAEEYMVDDKTGELRDYKFFCFWGKVKFYKIDFDRFTGHRANYYDLNHKVLPFGEKVCPPDFERQLEQPHNLKKMVQLAEKLAEGIPFVRVDFYEVNNKVFFGEITFYPGSGFVPILPEEWDIKIGNLIDLNLNNHCK